MSGRAEASNLLTGGVRSHAIVETDLVRPERSAAALGYRMPAEWELQSAVWVTPPHNPETWPGAGAFDRAVTQHAAWVQAMRDRGIVVRTPGEIGAATDDSWIRDYGPIFVVRDEEPEADAPSAGGEAIALHDFRFNAWGGKYVPVDRDDVAPQRIARHEGWVTWVHDLVLEGGSIEVNGRGTVMTTTQCLFGEGKAGRNPDLTPAEIEAEIHAALGTRHMISLPGGILGDDTDGHIDDVARFIDATTVAIVVPHEDHPDYGVLSQNLTALRRAQDQDDQPLSIVELPAPEPIEHDFPADRFGPGGRAPLPASYANFLISNRYVFLPVFGQAADDRAVAALVSAMPGHEIVPIRAEHLVVGLGACHCLSMQQPADPAEIVDAAK